MTGTQRKRQKDKETGRQAETSGHFNICRFDCFVAQARERECILETVQRHVNAGASISSEKALQGLPGEPLSVGGERQQPPIEFRYFALRKPLATIQDEDFFVNLVYVARGEAHERLESSAAERQAAERGSSQRTSLAEGRRILKESADSSRQAQNAQKKEAPATARANERQQQAGFAAVPLPHNLVAIDRLGFRKAIVKDEKLCSNYEAKLQVGDSHLGCHGVLLEGFRL